jgi:hypothetical protein
MFRPYQQGLTGYTARVGGIFSQLPAKNDRVLPASNTQQKLSTPHWCRKVLDAHLTHAPSAARACAKDKPITHGATSEI